MTRAQHQPDPALLDALREAAPRLPSSVEAGHHLVDDLGLDSIGLARLVVELENRFDCDLPPERLGELRDATVADLVELLEQATPADRDRPAPVGEAARG
ncbi:MAG: acyl carrier protein [Acidobacteriota bacterium]